MSIDIKKYVKEIPNVYSINYPQKVSDELIWGERGLNETYFYFACFPLHFYNLVRVLRYDISVNYLFRLSLNGMYVKKNKTKNKTDSQH